MLGWWGVLSKRQRKSAIPKHYQSTYHDTLILLKKYDFTRIKGTAMFPTLTQNVSRRKNMDTMKTAFALASIIYQ